MTARVLVVDDIVANVRLLEAKLQAEYFEVITAMNGLDALEVVLRVRPDIVLLDVMMPGIDGFEVCARIKANPATSHIPVVMITAMDQTEERIKGLKAGADDFLTKPVNDLALFSRLRSLVRLKMLTDELRQHVDDGAATGIMPRIQAMIETPGRVLCVESRETSRERTRLALKGLHEVEFCNPVDALSRSIAATPYDLIIISLGTESFDGLRLVAQLRSSELTRHLPILVIIDAADQALLLRSLDMGVNDYLTRPVDRQELVARVNTQVKRWRFTEQLRKSVQISLELAVTDALTGLYNRRYLETHLSYLIDDHMSRGKQLSLLAIDADHFKAINDTHGHDAGDAVLKELSSRIRGSTRGIDLCCRTGGEEFIVVLPGIPLDVASLIAERLRKLIATRAFVIGERKSIHVTVSIGVGQLDGLDDSQSKLLKRADEALYVAKREGRNRVELKAA
ncbi:MAG: PleD family two-component system response regulator [Pseudomonadota bacterium]|nr:PleD family two-component system response regulator [Pseudomonadota bacterium]